jgi:hypothetical protein
MKNDSPLRGVVTVFPAGPRPVTRDRVRPRARKVAAVAGRHPSLVSLADYTRARQELTGESDPDRRYVLLESLPDETRWSPAPSSTGNQVRASTDDRENFTGRTEMGPRFGAGTTAAATDRQHPAARFPVESVPDEGAACA